MAYTFHEQVIGVPQFGSTDTVQSTGLGRVMRLSDPAYGEAEAMYLLATAAITRGQVVTFSRYNKTAVLWTGTANGAQQLAVAGQDIAAGSYGFFFISGAVPVAVSGTVTVGAPLYYQANGVLSSTAVGGKQVIGAIPATAAGVPVAGLAVVELNRPNTQGATT